MHHDRSIDHPIVVLHFAELPVFLNTLNWETCRCITHGNVLNLWHHDSFFFLHMSKTMCKMTNSTHHITVRFFFCALPSIPHFIISFQPTHLLSVNLYPFQNVARGHPRRPSDLANSSFQYRWTDSSPRPCAK